jgi:hypothetical protein
MKENMVNFKDCQYCQFLSWEWINKRGEQPRWIPYCTKQEECIKEKITLENTYLSLKCPSCDRTIYLDFIEKSKRAIFHCWECDVYFIVSIIDYNETITTFEF